LLLPTPFGSLLQQPPSFPPNKVRPMPPTPQTPSPLASSSGKKRSPLVEQKRTGKAYPKKSAAMAPKRPQGRPTDGPRCPTLPKRLENVTPEASKSGLEAGPRPKRRKCESDNYLLCFKHVNPHENINFRKFFDRKRIINPVSDKNVPKRSPSGDFGPSKCSHGRHRDDF